MSGDRNPLQEQSDAELLDSLEVALPEYGSVQSLVALRVVAEVAKRTLQKCDGGAKGAEKSIG